MNLIDRDAYKQELEKAIYRNLRIGRPNPVVLMTLQYAIAKLDSAPVVDAVPVSYIQQRIDRLRVLAEYEAEANGGYIGRSDMAKFELEELIKYWKAEREQNV